MRWLTLLLLGCPATDEDTEPTGTTDESETETTTGSETETESDTEPTTDTEPVDLTWPMVWGEEGVWMTGNHIAASAEQAFVLGRVSGTWTSTVGEQTTQGKDVLVARINAVDATVDWSGSLGTDSDYEYLSGVAPTYDGGAVFVGYGGSTMDLDPGLDTLEHVPSSTDADTWVVRMGDEGTLQWAAVFSGSGRVEAYDVTTRNDGSVIVAGWAIDTELDLDPGEGEVLVTSTGYSTWIVSLDPNGEYQWGGLIEAEEYPGEVVPLQLESDSEGNVYLVGYFTGATDLGAVSGGAEVDADERNDGFVVSYDTDGEVRWHAVLAGEALNVLPYATQLAGDSLWLAGFFDGEFDADPGESESLMTNEGGYDLFWMALSASDGSYRGGRSLGGEDDELAYHIAKQSDGTLSMIGTFSGTTDFDPFPNESLLTASEAGATFFASWADDGTLNTAVEVTFSANDTYGVAEDRWVVGAFSEEADLGLWGPPYVKSPTGDSDVVIWME